MGTDPVSIKSHVIRIFACLLAPIVFVGLARGMRLAQGLHRELGGVVPSTLPSLTLPLDRPGVWEGARRLEAQDRHCR
jgi:hypothetical protein